uniref:Death domain-containing protein n=1 Tax=Branchiostoma floridae TaxID=7739 RepID=C3Y8G8_BRAFL|eukprot:XP_002607395.1 hypothetical protein BRAFLDRAFT_69806 [Branchiostoma floridae]
MMRGTLFLFLLCCSAQGLDVQGHESGTVQLPLSSMKNPEFVGDKDLYLVIVHDGNREPTQVLKWTTRTLLSTSEVFLPQFEGRMSLINGPDHPRKPWAVQIRNLRPSDAVTDGYFQFQQPDDAKGERIDLRVLLVVETTVTASQTPGMKQVEQPNSSRENHSFSTEAIMIACVLGGLSLVLVGAMVGIWFWFWRRNSTEGTRTMIDSCQSSPPVQASSLCSSYEEEQNNINLRRPPMPRIRPSLHARGSPFQLDGAMSVLATTPANRLPDHIINNEAISPQFSDDNTNPKAVSSGRPIHRATGTSSPDINTQKFTDASRSMSSDGSTATEPHSLLSGPRQLNSRNCPQLEDMISYSTGTEPTQNGVSTDPTKCPYSGQIKKQNHLNKATPSREATRQNGGFRATMETMMEDTIAEDGGGGQVSNREGRRVDVSELRAMSLNGNQVATTIDRMLRKFPMTEGNLDIPYQKFSELCLQLYNTHNNWKVLADRLGLTSGDILLIDNCSAQHNLPAAEIVLRHWQRTARHDKTSSTPCTLQNLRTILQDMGRADLVSMLNK